MAQISVPQTFIDEHTNWHHAYRAGAAGAGLQFLTFHRSFLHRVRAWNRGARAVDPAALEPWTAIPPALKNSSHGWSSQHATIEGSLSAGGATFPTPDDLGRGIDPPSGTNIHNLLHNAAARAYSDQALLRFHTSPQSTYFYQLHGLINRWWELWSAAKGRGQSLRPGPLPILSQLTGKAIDVPGGSSAQSGTAVLQWDFHGGDNQRFWVDPMGDGYRVMSVANGKVLDLAGGGTADGTKIVLWDWHGGRNQLFGIEKLTDASYRIVSKQTNKVIDLAGGRTDNGAPILQWFWQNSPNQKWNMFQPR